MTESWKSNIEKLDKTIVGNSRKLIESLSVVTPKIFETKSRKERTRIVKICLVNLGHSIGEKVYTNGLSEEDVLEIGNNFANKEWLFDIHWYQEKAEYLPTKLTLACESEWGIKRKFDNKNNYSSLKYDFQKLLTTNAELKLMIFKIAKIEDLTELEKYFKDAIKTFENLELNSKFLFIGFLDKTKQFYYKEFDKL